MVGQGRSSEYRLIDPKRPSRFQQTVDKVVNFEHLKPSDDDPLVQVTVMNPLAFLKKWLKQLLRDEGIHLKFSLKIRPLTVVFIVILFLAAGLGWQTLSLFFKYTPVYQPLRQLVTQPDQSYQLALVGQVVGIQDQVYLLSQTQSPVVLSGEFSWAEFAQSEVVVVGRYNPETNLLVASAVEPKTQPLTPPQTVQIELDTSQLEEFLETSWQSREATGSGQE